MRQIAPFALGYLPSAIPRLSVAGSAVCLYFLLMETANACLPATAQIACKVPPLFCTSPLFCLLCSIGTTSEYGICAAESSSGRQAWPAPLLKRVCKKTSDDYNRHS